MRVLLRMLVTGVLPAILAAGAAGARAASLPGVALSSTAPIGAALDTATPLAGGGYAISIGGNCVENQAGCSGPRIYAYGSHPVELVVLRRGSLAPVLVQGLGAGPRSALIAYGLAVRYGNSGNYLAVLAARPGAGATPIYAQAISVITGSPHAGQVNWSGGWGAAGVPSTTRHPGEVWGTLNPGFVAEDGHPAGDLHGYFQQAQLTPTVSQFQFVSGRYLTYDTQAPGSCPVAARLLSGLCSGPAVDVIRIGQTRYTLALPDPVGCRGGYAILVLNSVSLTPVSQGAYGTNCTSGVEDSAGWRAVNATLARAASSARSLVFMQSIGNAANPGCQCTSFGFSAGQALEALGATAEKFNRSLLAGGYLNEHGNSGYAMVGSPRIGGDALSGSHPESFAPESVSTITSHNARLQGMLRGDYDWNYLPVTGFDSPKPLGETPATAEFLPATSWPTGRTPGQQKVLQYISAGTPGGPFPFVALSYSSASSCYRPAFPDVRFEFCDLSRTYDDVEKALTKDVPAACGCSQPDWQDVTQDLSYEISARDIVMKGFGALAQVFGSGSSCSNARLDLTSISQQIEKVVKPGRSSVVGGGFASALAGDVLNVISAFLYTKPDDTKLADAAIGLNILSAGAYLAADLVSVINHYEHVAPSLAQRVSTTAANLGPLLTRSYCTTQFGLGRAEAAILSDYGRLKAQATSTSIQFDKTTLDALTPYVQMSAKRFIYERLLPVIYHAYALVPDGRENPSGVPVAKYRCGNNAFGEHGYPWAGMPPGATLDLLPQDPVNPFALTLFGYRHAVGIVLSSRPNFRRIFRAGNPSKPPKSLMQAITGSITSGGLGVSTFDLLLHHFRRYAIVCRPYDVGYHNAIYGPSDVSWP